MQPNTAPLKLEAAMRRKGAWFEGHGVDWAAIQRRAPATRAIAAAFPAFETVREVVLGRKRAALHSPVFAELTRVLCACEVLEEDAPGAFSMSSTEASRYLRGGWLEDYAGLVAEAAGADEIRVGQLVRWRASGFEGVNEIDTIARFGERLVFVSAKAFRSELKPADAQHRSNLMHALQEADNLVDHFGNSQSAVVLLVTTDLIDERDREPRYEQFYGKAAALGVALLTLDDLAWETIVRQFTRLGSDPLPRGGSSI